MYSVAMVLNGCVYGVLLVENDEVQRAWIDPEIEPGTMCEKMEFHSDPAEVMEAIQKILDVRYIPEVDPKLYVFNLNPGGNLWKINLN